MVEEWEVAGRVTALVVSNGRYTLKCLPINHCGFIWREWKQNIRPSLDVVEGTYQVVSDQSAAVRVELLKITVILLIALEIVLTLGRHQFGASLWEMKNGLKSCLVFELHTHRGMAR